MMTAANNSELSGRFEWVWRALDQAGRPRASLGRSSVVYPDTYDVLSGLPTNFRYFITSNLKLLQE